MTQDQGIPEPTIDLGRADPERPPDGAPRLIVVVGKSQNAVLELGGDSTEGLTIGRDDGCDLVLDSPVVSARHARVVRDGERMLVEDTDSTNGVYVNGARLEVGESHALEHGDAVKISDHVLLYVSRQSIADRTDFGTIQIDGSKASEEAEALMREFASLRRHRGD